jgi:hypothetical protein
MELIYRYSESTVKPSELEIGKRTVFLRKDFEEIERYDEVSDTTVTFWTYQEAKLTHEEFAEYSKYVAASNAIKGTNDSENIKGLVVGQENGDNNQLIIMEAIADLYDAVASIM